MPGALVLSDRLSVDGGKKHSEAYMSEYQQLVQEENKGSGVKSKWRRCKAALLFNLIGLIE